MTYVYGGWVRSVKPAPRWWQFRYCKICGKKILGEHVRVLNIDSTRWFVARAHYFCSRHDPLEQLQRERPNG